MANSSVIPLSLLYIDNKSIEGATKLQKLIFLAQKEGSLPEEFQFDYESNKYGPYSVDLAVTLEELEDRGLIETEEIQNRSGNTVREYKLTDFGYKVTQEILNERESELEPIFNEMSDVKHNHGAKSLDRLLRYVYNKYPGYTDKSELDEYVRN